MHADPSVYNNSFLLYITLYKFLIITCAMHEAQRVFIATPLAQILYQQLYNLFLGSCWVQPHYSLPTMLYDGS